jgi:excisionase family DNA binding protein
MTKEKDRYITVQHAAERLSVTDRHIYLLVRSGDLRAMRVGPRALRISEQSLEEFIDSQQIDPADLYEPEEPPQKSQPELSPQKPARSQWMSK